MQEASIHGETSLLIIERLLFMFYVFVFILFYLLTRIIYLLSYATFVLKQPGGRDAGVFWNMNDKLKTSSGKKSVLVGLWDGLIALPSSLLLSYGYILYCL
jgi:hypothetical protein